MILMRGLYQGGRHRPRPSPVHRIAPGRRPARGRRRQEKGRGVSNTAPIFGGTLALIAVGGNSLLPPERVVDGEADPVRLGQTCEAIADILASGWRVVITHGNGPQVGFNLLRMENAGPSAPRLPLDVLGAQTQGSLGYALQQALGDALGRRGVDSAVASVVTQVVVDPDDPAFRTPTKPVGPFYPADQTAALRARGWQLVREGERGWRRVVPSPRPREVIELEVVRALVQAGVVVVAAGGGGIPVIRREGRLQGCEAVVDKDRASALLAAGLDADLLVITTDVEHVALDYETPRERPVGRLTMDEARAHLRGGQFPSGSMGPKIEAAVEFIDGGGRDVLITSPDALSRALRGAAGTRIVRT